MRSIEKLDWDGYGCVIITGIEFFDKRDILLPEDQKEDSALYYPIYDATGIFFDGIKDELNGLEP